MHQAVTQLARSRARHREAALRRRDEGLRARLAALLARFR
jgi:hypothetical protein